MQTDLTSKNAIKKIFSLFDKKDWVYMYLSIFLILIASAADLLNPFFFAKILNTISKNGNSLSMADVDWVSVSMLFVLAVISFISLTSAICLSTSVAVKTGANIRIKTFNRTQVLSASDIDQIGSSSIITRISNDAGQIVEFLKGYNTMAVRAVSLLLGGLVLSIIQLATFQGDPVIWFLCLSYVFIFGFIILLVIMTKKSGPIFQRARTTVDSNNTIMEENIIGNKIIRIFNLQENQRNKYQQGNEKLLEHSIKSDRLVAVLIPIANLTINFSTVLIVLFGGLYSWWSIPADYEITINLIGVIMSFIQYLTYMTIGLIIFSQFGYTWVRGNICSQRLFQILETKNSIVDCENPKDITSNSIEFKNVSFKYHSNEEKQGGNVLSNINLKVPANSSLGIIGQSGSGKTTLVSLISRLYDVTAGEVIISDTNIKEISLNNLKENIAVSLQDKILLHGTIKSNIKLGKPNATIEEVTTAAKQAQAWDFIISKENQLMSKVEQRGSNLSGGQKQRISIARALIKKPKILIFDDSTSALDTITEKAIMKTLSKDFKNTTKIIVSQKIKSIKDCDNIIVLSDGKIVQSGIHDELILDNDGIYKKIYDSQNTSIGE
ncbi:MAG: ABC transporter ATP-binding protein [Mycoplasma sp.]